MQLALLERLLRSEQAGRATVMVTAIRSGCQMLIEEAGRFGTLELDDTSFAIVQRAIEADTSMVVETSDGEMFVEVWNPPLRLILIGAVHVAQILAPMAKLSGYKVIIVDPRDSYAAAHRFPDFEIKNDWPDEALEKIKPDKRTALVTLTHDPKIDDPALLTALRSAAFYIGSLGSVRTHTKRIERLSQAGITDAVCARIHGPVGLNIGALTPAEIAVSIMAEITLTLRADRIKTKLYQRRAADVSPAKPVAG